MLVDNDAVVPNRLDVVTVEEVVPPVKEKSEVYPDTIGAAYSEHPLMLTVGTVAELNLEYNVAVA